MVKLAKKPLFPWIMVVWIEKNVIIVSYIAAFVNSTKGLQWIGATRRRYTGSENLGNHRCGKYSTLAYGDLEQGFARVRCPDCHHEYLLAFSCRGRWFCPSCHSKKVIQFGSRLHDNVLFPVPHRQYVFSIPKIVRRYFLYDRKLLGKLSQCAASFLTSFFGSPLAVQPPGCLGVRTISPAAVISR